MTIALIGNPNNTGRRGNRMAVPQAKNDHVPLDVVEAALARTKADAAREQSLRSAGRARVAERVTTRAVRR